MSIRLLSETIINQIAAGEVVERPASVVKELVENAIDAGATRIEVATAGGGKNLIRITDNGSGIAEDELLLAVSRHCTSKMGEDIHDIRALGFRGEALPSIGSVSQLRLTSRTQEAKNSAEIIVKGGKIDGPRPAAGNCGTIVEVRDLFFSTPARLKFLKTDRAETTAITDIIKRIAIAFPHIRFTLSGPDRSPLDLPATGKNDEARIARLAQIMGKDFAENSVRIDATRENVRLTGFAGIPSFNRGNALQQFVYVNGRPIRDKMIAGAIRGAYADAIARDRHGVAALFIEIAPEDVDVNVHPAKADVRFRDPGLVRGLIVGSIREALTNAGIRPATTGSTAMFNAFRPYDAPSPTAAQQHYSAAHFSQASPHHEEYSGYRPQQNRWTPETAHPANRPLEADTRGFAEQESAFHVLGEPSADMRATMEEIPADLTENPLGAARAQIHKNYIVAQTQDSLIIVDQHAAHERLVYEALKEALYAKPLTSQILLIPEIVDLPEDDVNRLIAHAKTLKKFGLGIEAFGPGAIAVSETPAMLGQIDASALIRDLADEVADHDTTEGLKSMLDYVAATMACHGSVRSGRILKPQEMNALLRQMEATPGSGTCNHGRPTYIELKLIDIERLFSRR